ncbi:MAG: energy-coupling factor ABC transporter ATP-binding protein [Clostridia bacterium]|nr:energy-coupling factor ABC transporter ATP-binding protein [Clostridia bacterium]
MALLTVENLSFTYAGEETPALQDVSFSIRRGEMVVLCGATGCGKSTLMRLFKREISPMGEVSGEILLGGTPTASLSVRESAARIGYVMQHPEEQIVTDKVWHELAFGLESLGYPRDAIRRRVAEMASYFDIEPWFDKDTASLSGGQKQLLNLAAVLVTDPELLLLDEPTAQLDPIAAADFIDTLRRLNRELGLTMLLIEHRPEEVMPICDRLMIMEEGRLLAIDTPRRVMETLGTRPEILCGMPASVRLFHTLGENGTPPLGIREGREFLKASYANDVRALPHEPYTHGERVALSMKNVCFRYEKTGADVLRDTTLEVFEGEILCLLGANGSGKTTALSVAAGLFKPYSGTVRVFGKKQKDYRDGSLYRSCVALLPQNVQTVFLKSTVREELADAGADPAALPYDLTHLMARHPYDLSGGERQLVALAKVLATSPRLLLADEPTKGLDANAKRHLIEIFRTLKQNGVTVVIVTHDTELAAELCDRAALFFRGGIASISTPRAFFSENRFYTTAVSRMTRGIYDNAVTQSDAVSLCRQNGRRGGAS